MSKLSNSMTGFSGVVAGLIVVGLLTCSLNAVGANASPKPAKPVQSPVKIEKGKKTTGSGPIRK